MPYINMRGRWRRSYRKPTTQQLPQLDIADITPDILQGVTTIHTWRTRNGDIKDSITVKVLPGKGLHLSHNQPNQLDNSYIVPITYTMPNYGGKRPWFLCPGCGKRVRILYGRGRFLCRNCRELTYKSRQVARVNAMEIAIHNRKCAVLGRLVNDGDRIPGRPRNMHRMTYMQLATEYARLVELEERAVTASLVHAFGRSVPSELSPENEWQQLKIDRR